MTATNDSNELEALFDSIAAGNVGAAPEAPAPVAAPPKAPGGAVGDNDDLQALFDSVSAEYVAEESAPPAAEPSVQPEAAAPVEGGDWPRQEAVFNRIGQMARQLHDTLRELGYDKMLEATMSALPDAKDRLAYVANLTEQAACRVLNATDIANPLVESVEESAAALAGRWDKVFANELGVADFKQLAEETRAYLKQQVPEKMGATKTQLTEIMMAQDFQDLTGQVIKKIVALAQDLESGLMNVLIEVVPEQRRTKGVDSLMNGPVISAEGRSDVVVNQQQVDDLLGSLGF